MEKRPSDPALPCPALPLFHLGYFCRCVLFSVLIALNWDCAKAKRVTVMRDVPPYLAAVHGWDRSMETWRGHGSGAKAHIRPHPGLGCCARSSNHIGTFVIHA
ncbi:hypothetical protein B0T22DRAFT_448262 [Podospora appendiculata]|uniref:Uncharacterized protein n=1 Tax=Podospora appendiculata TaxID=314037 RepID=A0AAE0XG67_9PEZI|nr:hypothetical protein B0T22DRAFT_448262 [Podospora appendiculata]